LADLMEGRMKEFDVDGSEIIVLWPTGGTPKAYGGLCPHQGLPLSDGAFDGTALVCAAHRWRFDAATGESIWPRNCRLSPYPLRIEGGDVFIDIGR
jgi:toluene monooxygenase system ferredoxin subunit